MADKKTKHKKYQQKEGPDGWTSVVRGPRLPSEELGRPGNIEKSIRSDEVDQDMSISDIRRRYQMIHKQWAEEPSLKRFEEVMDERIELQAITIDNVFVLGLGSLASRALPEDSMQQLVACEHWIAYLRTKYPKLQVYFQDPAFKLQDTLFLTELGYKVIENPEAYLELTPNSLLFAPCVPWVISYTFLYMAYPVLLITNSVFIDMTWMMSERREILVQSVVKDFFTSRHSARLGDKIEKINKSPASRARWLHGMVLYWPNIHTKAGHNAEEESKICQYFAELEQERTGQEVKMSQSNRLVDVGEWCSKEGFVFNQDFKNFEESYRKKKGEDEKNSADIAGMASLGQNLVKKWLKSSP